MMNAENFHDFLKNPSKLFQVNYHELKSLVLQYPYSPNLRFLLLVKSQLENHKDLERNLISSALYSLDRDRLFKKVKHNSRLQQIQENYSLIEDYLELKDLTTLEEVIVDSSIETNDKNNADRKELSVEVSLSEVEGFDDASPTTSPGDTPEPVETLLADYPGDSESKTKNSVDEIEDLIESPVEQVINTPEVGEEEKATNRFDEVPASASNDLEQETEASGQIIETTLEQPEAPESTYLSEEFTIGSHVEANLEETGAFEEFPTETNTVTWPQEKTVHAPQPLPKSNFSSWLRKLSPPSVTLLSGDLHDIIQTKKNARAKDQEFDVADKLAAQSIEEDENLTSETLAALFEAQGHYSKAIAMYKRLILQNPEKSSFFAAKIEKLKKK